MSDEAAAGAAAGAAAVTPTTPSAAAAAAAAAPARAATAAATAAASSPAAAIAVPPARASSRRSYHELSRVPVALSLALTPSPQVNPVDSPADTSTAATLATAAVTATAAAATLAPAAAVAAAAAAADATGAVPTTSSSPSQPAVPDPPPSPARPTNESATAQRHISCGDALHPPTPSSSPGTTECGVSPVRRAVPNVVKDVLMGVVAEVQVVAETSVVTDVVTEVVETEVVTHVVTDVVSGVVADVLADVVTDAVTGVTEVQLEAVTDVVTDVVTDMTTDAVADVETDVVIDAVTDVVTGATEVQLEARVWRECRFFELRQPTAGAAGAAGPAEAAGMSGVFACVRLRPAAAAKLYDIVRVWLVNNHTCQVHSSRVLLKPRTAVGWAPGCGSGTIVMTSREGPAWELCSSCDVVVLLRLRSSSSCSGGCSSSSSGSGCSSSSGRGGSSSSVGGFSGGAGQSCLAGGVFCRSTRTAGTTARRFRHMQSTAATTAGRGLSIGEQDDSALDFNASGGHLFRCGAGGAHGGRSAHAKYLLLRTADEAVAVEVVVRKVDMLFILLRVLMAWLYTLLVLPLESCAVHFREWPRGAIGGGRGRNRQDR